MVGHIITRYFESNRNFYVINVSRSKLNENTIIIDVENRDLLQKKLIELKPEYVINCIGTLIKESKEHPDLSIFLNSYLPHYLAKLGRILNFKLIHLSTDCVFSGEKGGYSESDFKDGKDMYAKSKALGEIINDKDLTFRTSMIGPELKKFGTGLFHWFMTQIETVYGYSKVYWTGITTLELAKAIEQAIIQDLRGLYHLVPDYKISKYDLVLLMKEIWNKSINIIKQNNIVSDKSLINNRTDFKFRVDDYRTMLKELHEWMKNYNYNYY